MSLRWKPVALGLMIAIAVIGVAVFSSARSNTSTPQTSLPATWTPTPAGADQANAPVQAVSLGVTSTPIRLKVLPLTTATSTVAAVVVEATEIPIDYPESGAEAIATPSPVPRTDQGAERVDQEGPVRLPTTEPLARGSGLPPVRLQIPVLGLDVPVEPMGWKVIRDRNGVRSEWDVVDNAAGHHINSAYPGEAGNVVLSGHNNIGGAVFQSVCVIGEPGVAFDLGDEMILVDEAGRRFTYRVNGWRRMKEANASISKRQDNARYMQPTEYAQLTLVTCWPPWSNTHRVVVTGLLTGMELN